MCSFWIHVIFLLKLRLSNIQVTGCLSSRFILKNVKLQESDKNVYFILALAQQTICNTWTALLCILWIHVQKGMAFCIQKNNMTKTTVVQVWMKKFTPYKAYMSCRNPFTVGVTSCRIIIDNVLLNGLKMSFNFMLSKYVFVSDPDPVVFDRNRLGLLQCCVLVNQRDQNGCACRNRQCILKGHFWEGHKESFYHNRFVLAIIVTSICIQQWVLIIQEGNIGFCAYFLPWCTWANSTTFTSLSRSVTAWKPTCDMVHYHVTIYFAAIKFATGDCSVPLGSSILHPSV